MEKDITKLTDVEIDSLGYQLYESKEQLLVQLNQANQSLLIIRAEKQSRKLKEEKKEEKLE